MNHSPGLAFTQQGVCPQIREPYTAYECGKAKEGRSSVPSCVPASTTAENGVALAKMLTKPTVHRGGQPPTMRGPHGPSSKSQLPPRLKKTLERNLALCSKNTKPKKTRLYVTWLRDKDGSTLDAQRGRTHLSISDLCLGPGERLS